MNSKVDVDLGTDAIATDITPSRTNFKTHWLFLLLFTAATYLAVSPAHANDADIEECREHKLQLTIIESKLNQTDENIHKYLKNIKNKKGIEALVFIYDFDKDTSTFKTEVNDLAGKTFKKFSVHALAFAKCLKNEDNTPDLGSQLIDKYLTAITHQEKHITWFEDPETQQKFAGFQNDAHRLLGEPTKDNLVALYKLASNVFARFSINSKAANSFEMWEVAEAIGVKRFAAETGINLSKNSPENKRKREKQRLKDMGVDMEPLIFDSVPEGAKYPHNYYAFKSEITYHTPNRDIEKEMRSQSIINRNLLALRSLQFEKYDTEVKQMQSDYQQAMNKFKALAGARFEIKNWQDLPQQVDSWLDSAQYWSIEQYQLMQLRLNAIHKMTDPKADANWNEMNKKLGVE